MEQLHEQFWGIHDKTDPPLDLQESFFLFTHFKKDMEQLHEPLLHPKLRFKFYARMSAGSFASASLMHTTVLEMSLFTVATEPSESLAVGT